MTTMATTPLPASFPAADEDTVAALQGAVGVLAAKWSVVVLARVPARVEYELSPVGEHLLEALAPLAGWGLRHQRDVTDAREHFDRLQRWRAESAELQA